MLAPNESGLREAHGFAANFNRANRRGNACGGKSTHSHAVGDRVGALLIKMLGANELPLRDVAYGNINRAHKRWSACGASMHAPRCTKSGRRRGAPTSDALSRGSSTVYPEERILCEALNEGADKSPRLDFPSKCKRRAETQFPNGALRRLEALPIEMLAPEHEGASIFLIRHFTALASNIRFANIARH